MNQHHFHAKLAGKHKVILNCKTTNPCRSSKTSHGLPENDFNLIDLWSNILLYSKHAITLCNQKHQWHSICNNAAEQKPPLDPKWNILNRAKHIHFKLPSCNELKSKIIQLPRYVMRSWQHHSVTRLGFLEGLGDKLFYISSPNIRQLFGLFLKFHFLSKNCCGHFGDKVWKNWATFSPTPGHTWQHHNLPEARSFASGATWTLPCLGKSQYMFCLFFVADDWIQTLDDLVSEVPTEPPPM